MWQERRERDKHYHEIVEANAAREFFLQKTTRFVSHPRDSGSAGKKNKASFAGSKRTSSVFVSFCLRTHRCIRDIRGSQFKNFPRYLAPEFTHYLSERLEMSFSQQEVTEGQTRKRTYENKIN